MLRFTVRELVLITVIVAMALGWWADRRKRDQEVSDKIERITAEYQAMRERRFP